ncbi:MAG: O-antigen ligase family protein [Bacteroidales bacterium]|jgi:hypothetical protein|nr:O-antigen ligase family protein [Bacteroidales bacterium]
MNQSKINTFFSTLNLVLCLVGYQFTTSVFSFVIPEAEDSRLLTVPYRAFALLVCLITIFLNVRSKFTLKPILKVLSIFWLLLLVRFAYDMYYRTDIFIFRDQVNQTWLYMVAMTIIPMYSIMKSYRNIDFDMLLKWTYILLSVAICFTFFSNQSFQEDTESRLDANIALITINTGHMGLTAIILSIYILVKKNLPKISKIIVIGISILSIFIWLRAGSRGPILAAIAIIAVLILGFSKHKVRNILLLCVLSIVGYLCIDYIMQGINYISPVLYDRFTYKASVGQTEDRNPLYLYAINSFLESPIIGKNFAVYGLAYGWMIYSHNVILDSIMQLGIIGGVMIIYILYKSIVRIIKLVNLRSPYVWISLLLMQQIMSVMVSGAIYENPLLSILIVLLFMPLNNYNYSLQRNTFREK